MCIPRCWVSRFSSVLRQCIPKSFLLLARIVNFLFMNCRYSGRGAFPLFCIWLNVFGHPIQTCVVDWHLGGVSGNCRIGFPLCFINPTRHEHGDARIERSIGGRPMSASRVPVSSSGPNLAGNGICDQAVVYGWMVFIVTRIKETLFLWMVPQFASPTDDGLFSHQNRTRTNVHMCNLPGSIPFAPRATFQKDRRWRAIEGDH